MLPVVRECLPDLVFSILMRFERLDGVLLGLNCGVYFRLDS
jgi:hypothetical protein